MTAHRDQSPGVMADRAQPLSRRRISRLRVRSADARGDAADSGERTSGGSAVVRLEDVGTGAQLRGVEPGAPVAVVAVQWHGTQALTLTFRRADGTLGERVVFRADEATLRPVAPRNQWVVHFRR